jgi:hypothetical protein
VAGRDFTDRDDPGAPSVVIINETMARRFWPGQDVVGRTFKSNGRNVTIIGVAKTGKYRALNEPAECFYYIPHGQSPSQLDLGICLRSTSGDPAAMTTAVRNEIHSIDPNVQVWDAMPLKNYIEAAVLPQTIASTLLAFLGGVSLVLAAMGVYAVMAYSVSQRRHEIGIRMALGATSQNVLWQVSRTALVLTASGITIGLVASVWTTRLLAGFLYGIDRFDAATFILIPILLTGIAALACFVPARRATLVDPVEALRTE